VIALLLAVLGAGQRIFLLVLRRNIFNRLEAKNERVVSMRCGVREMDWHGTSEEVGSASARWISTD
jgi:hypothetical protein